ncbi:helix-turn-helix domain-containing protein [Halomicroarcula sp. GCM10025817]|uniref:ArsR/SmtB family transcription factor n=1 Tax=Haloarcula TaxID=2237 RepID=UPI0023E83EC8|nr:helix-turn-helix domain-containing protein [Halomicroarcula sp. SYNS111]
MSLLPSRGPEASTSQDGELEIVGVDEDVSAVIDALSSETAREILNAVYDDPGTPSELADRLGMSIQKVSYHLEKLEEEELIAVAGTRYSEKGQEMKVYQPPDDPLVLFVGTRERKRSLRALARRLVPVVGILTAASVAVQVITEGVPFVGQSASGDGGEAASGGGDAGADPTLSTTAEPTAEPTATAGGDGGGVSIAEATETQTPSGDDGGVSIAEATETPVPTEEPTVTPTEAPVSEPATTPTDVATELAEVSGAAGGFDVPPGLVFFLGGLLVVAVVAAVWAYDR